MRQAAHPRPLRGEQFVAVGSFFLLFPCFFYYHTVLGLGLSGAFLGGFFAPVSLLVVLPLSYLYIRRIKLEPNRLTRIDITFGLFMAYFGAVVAGNVVTGGSMVHVVHHILGILFMVNTFFMFKAIDFAGAAFRRVGLLSLAVMSGIVFYFSIDGVFYLGALGIARDAESLATYQGFSRSYLFTFAPVIAFTRAPLLRLALYAVGAPTLFFNTARSEFVALLCLIPIIEFYHSRNKLAVVMVFTALIVAVKVNLEQIVAYLPHNRILELLDLSQSTSANKRHHLTIYALQTINEHPLLGDFGSYPPGLYAHNVLSAWVDLGFPGVAYLMLMLVCPAIYIFIRDYFTSRQFSQFILAFSLACITVLLLLTSHFFTDMLIGATMACYSTYFYIRKYDKVRAMSPSPPSRALPRMRGVIFQHRQLRQLAAPARKAAARE